MAHWARVTSRRGGSEFESLDDLGAKVMAIASVLGVKMGERSKVIRAAGFEYGEPMQ
jgi:chorismate synthase